MKRIGIIQILMVLPTILFSQDLKIFHEDTSYLKYHPPGRCEHRTDFYHIKDSVLRDGKLSIYYDWNLTQIKYEIDFANFLKDGYYRYYSKSGFCYRTQRFKQDLRHGDFVEYDQTDSSLVETGTYESGVQSLYQGYYKNGGIRYERSQSDSIIVATRYHQNGQLHYKTVLINQVHPDGEEVGYFDNGEVEFRRFYKNGVPTGVWTEYYKSGMIQSERLPYLNSSFLWDKRYFENGELQYHSVRKPDGTVVKKRFHDNGKLKVEYIHHSRGLVDGTYLVYDEHGNVSAKETYVQGEKDGVWEEWYSNGIKKSMYIYQNGKPIGFGYEYHSKDGSVRWKTTYSDHQKVLFEEFYPNGSVMRIVPFDKGKIHGTVIFYNERGGCNKQFYEEGVQLSKRECP